MSKGNSDFTRFQLSHIFGHIYLDIIMVVMTLKRILKTDQNFTESQGLSKHIRRISSLNPHTNPLKEATCPKTDSRRGRGGALRSNARYLNLPFAENFFFFFFLILEVIVGPHAVVRKNTRRTFRIPFTQLPPVGLSCIPALQRDNQETDIATSTHFI